MGGKAPKAPADNSLQLQREQQAETARLKKEQDDKDAAQKVTDTTAFNNNLTAAQGSARNRLQTQFGSYGVDAASPQFSSIIDQAINDQSATVPSLDTAPANYFTNDWVSSVLSGARDQERNKLTGQVSQAFAPNYEDNYFNSNADDGIIADILGGQKTAAQTSIDAAKARGNINDSGYSTAMNELSNLYTSGMATGNTLGQSVLDRYKEGIAGIGSEAKTAASNYDFNTGNVDVGQYRSQLDNKVNEYSGALEGDVRNALAGQEFFNIGDILGAAGVRQGAVNPRTEDAGILAQREATRNAKRGLGGSGVF